MARYVCAERGGWQPVRWLRILGIGALTVSFASKAVASDGVDFVSGHVLVKLKAGVKQDEERMLLEDAHSRLVTRIAKVDVLIVDVPPTRTEAEQVAWFRTRSEVEFVELDGVPAPASVVPNDTYYNLQDELTSIGCPNAWTTTTGSSSVVIAILDTGVDGTHPDLAPNLVPGWNVYANNSNTTDVYSHGTFVAGTAAAVGNNGAGVASVAYTAKVMPIKISDNNAYTTFATIANGLIWAADHGARVANVSFLCSGSSTVCTAAQYFQNHGGVVCIAAGNTGASVNTPDSPYILTVSAVDADGSIASWSTTGPGIDLCAPSTSKTVAIGGGYGNAAGTSVSSPYVAGVAALVLAANPTLTGDQVQQMIKESATDLGPQGWDHSYGWGRLNAAGAVALAVAANGGSSSGGTGEGDVTAPTVEILSPTEGTVVTNWINIHASATDETGVSRIEFYVDGVLKGTKAGGDATYKWRTQNAAPGAHQLVCKAYDAANNVGTSQSVTVYH
jgi:thermitase